MAAGLGEPPGATAEPPPGPSDPPARPGRRARRRDTAEVEREGRLAELVAGLTGSPKGQALHAVRHDAGPDTADALEVVARAMVKVDQPPPKELRLSRYVGPPGGDAEGDGDGRHGPSPIDPAPEPEP